MCNSVLRVKRRLLALLLIVGCMAISAPAFARVCFLPDSKDCGIPGIKDIPETCDGINTFTDVDDCKNNMADGQKCEPVNEGGCYAATCEYANKAACEADVDECFITIGCNNADIGLSVGLDCPNGLACFKRGISGSTVCIDYRDGHIIDDINVISIITIG